MFGFIGAILNLWLPVLLLMIALVYVLLVAAAFMGGAYTFGTILLIIGGIVLIVGIRGARDARG